MRPRYVLPPESHGAKIARAQTPRERRQAEEARNALVTDNLALCWWVLGRASVKNAVRVLGNDEAVCVAQESLVHAANLFDPARGVRFATYAYWVLATNINREAFGQGKKRQTPRPLVQSLSDLVIDGAEIDALLTPRPRDAIGEQQYTVEDDERREECVAMLSCLGPRQRKIMRLRFLEGLTLKAIGERVGYTRERVRQIVEASLREIRQRHGVGA